MVSEIGHERRLAIVAAGLKSEQQRLEQYVQNAFMNLLYKGSAILIKTDRVNYIVSVDYLGDYRVNGRIVTEESEFLFPIYAFLSEGSEVSFLSPEDHIQHLRERFC